MINTKDGAEPPAGLRWANTPTTRAIATFFALVAMVVAMYVGWRQTQFSACLAEQQRIDQKRTAALAVVTDDERRAQRALLANTDPAAIPALKLAALHAYDITDRARSEYPPRSPGTC